MSPSSRKVAGVKNEAEPKIVVNWRLTVGEPSPLWRRLWAQLLEERGPGLNSGKTRATTKNRKTLDESIPRTKRSGSARKSSEMP